MQFTETKLKSGFIIDIQKIEDDRGFFARSFCKNEFKEQGISSDLAQANISFNKYKGTLRGLHYQGSPHEEAKLVRCTKGAIFDVMVDLREDSPTFCQWVGAELTAENHRMLLIPEGFGHGFQTLEDNTEVIYQVSEFYTPSAEKGALYNDPAFGIEWPLDVSVISDKDANWAAFN